MTITTHLRFIDQNGNPVKNVFFNIRYDTLEGFYTRYNETTGEGSFSFITDKQFARFFVLNINYKHKRNLFNPHYETGGRFEGIVGGTHTITIRKYSSKRYVYRFVDKATGNPVRGLQILIYTGYIRNHHYGYSEMYFTDNDGFIRFNLPVEHPLHMGIIYDRRAYLREERMKVIYDINKNPQGIIYREDTEFFTFEPKELEKPPTPPPTPPTKPPTPPTPTPPTPPTPTPTPTLTPVLVNVRLIVRNVAFFPQGVIPIIPPIFYIGIDMASRIVDVEIEIYEKLTNRLIASGKTNAFGIFDFKANVKTTYIIKAKKEFFELLKPSEISVEKAEIINVWMRPAPITITDTLGNSLRAISKAEADDIREFFGIKGIVGEVDINTYLTRLLAKTKAHRLLDNWRDYWIKKFEKHTLDKDTKIDFVKRKYDVFFNKLGTIETIEPLPCNAEIFITTSNFIPFTIKYKLFALYGDRTLYESKEFTTNLSFLRSHSNTVSFTLPAKIIPKRVEFRLTIYHQEIKKEKLITTFRAKITY